MDIIVTGSSGFVGSALLPMLEAAGHRPIGFVRRPPAAGSDEIRWDPDAGTIDAASLNGIDGVIHLAGVGIADRRWSAKQRAAIMDSRVNATTLLAETLAGLDRPPSAFVSGSAIGFYGDAGADAIAEDAPAGTGFLADVCVAWEAAAQAAVDAGIRTVFARTGIVLDTGGGALGKQLPLFKFGLGGKLGNGSQWMSWITLADEVRALIHLLSSSLAGPVNLTAPEPVTNADFTAALGGALGRPTLLPIPRLGPRLLLGKDLAEQLLFWSANIEPRALLADGFEFEASTIDDAFARLFPKD